MGTLPLDLSSDPMYWNIQGIRTFAAEVNQAGGGAGTYAKIGLSIQGTNKLTVARILGVWITLPTSGSDVLIYRVAEGSYTSDPGIYGYGTDTRIPEAQTSQAIMINSTDNTLPGTRLGRITVGLNQYLPTELPLIVNPGQAIYFLNGTATATLQLMLAWVEIPAYRAET